LTTGNVRHITFGLYPPHSAPPRALPSFPGSPARRPRFCSSLHECYQQSSAMPMPIIFRCPTKNRPSMEKEVRGWRRGAESMIPQLTDTAKGNSQGGNKRVGEWTGTGTGTCRRGRHDLTSLPLVRATGSLDVKVITAVSRQGPGWNSNADPRVCGTPTRAKPPGRSPNGSGGETGAYRNVKCRWGRERKKVSWMIGNW